MKTPITLAILALLFGCAGSSSDGPTQVIETTVRTTDLVIKNKSSLIVEEFFLQKGNKDITYSLPEYAGGINAIYAPQLTFLFGENAMALSGDSVYPASIPDDVSGSFPVTFSTKKSVDNYNRRTDLGFMNISFKEISCDDTDFNSFTLVLVTDGEVLIEGLLNTELFLTDSDGDGIDEIYLFSFRSCESSLKLIRIKFNSDPSARIEDADEI